MILLMCFLGGSRSYAQQTLCYYYRNYQPDVTLSGTYNSVVYYSGKTIYISNDVTFNNTALFVNCIIKVELGKEIFIKAPNSYMVNKYATFRNCKLFANTCDGLWLGIRVEQRHLGLFSCQIEDAYDAVKLNHGSYLSSDQTIFNRNLIGIFISNHNQGNNPSTAYLPLFSGNSFTCTSNLNYNVNNTVSDIGIWCFYSTGKVHLGQGASQVNLFKDILRGILASNSAMKIENCRFENIKSNNDFFNLGIAIEAANSLSQAMDMEITGIGGTESSTPTFSQSYLADVKTSGPFIVSIKNCKSTISGTTNTLAHQGFLIDNNSYGKVTIENNYFELNNISAYRTDNNRRTIAISNSEGLIDPSRIRYNTFIDNLVSPGSNYKNGVVDIHIDKVSLACSKKLIGGARCEFLISNNTIEQTGIENSINILVESSKNIITEANNITRNKSGSLICNRPSIKYSESPDGSISFNEFYTDGGKESQVGIYVIGSSKPGICANMMYNERKSLVIEGNCPNAYVASNLFGSTSSNVVIGMNYLSGARANYVNKHTGNYWEGTFSDKEARHDGGTYPANKFQIRSNNYGQSSIKYWPTSKFPTGNAWIEDNSGDLEGCVDPFGDGGGSDLLDGFQPYCDNEFTNSLSEGQLWDSYHHLIRIVNDFNLQDSLDCLEILYDSLMVTTIPDYYALREDFNNLYALDTVAYNNLINEIDSLQSLSDIINTELIEIGEGVNDSTNINSTVLDSLQILYESQGDLVDSLYQLINTETLDEAEVLYSANEELDSNLECEKNEKFTNRIYLDKILQYEISSEDVDSLNTIARGCINDLGNVVLKAQSLLPDSLAFYRDTLMFCEETEELVLATDKLEEANEVWLKPNPVTDKLKIQILSSKGKQWIEVLDIDGKKLINRLVNQNDEIDFEQLMPGIYMIKVYDQKDIFLIKKIIKI